MKREIVIKLDRGEINEIVMDYLNKMFAHDSLDGYARKWTDIQNAHGDTLIDDPACPEAFLFHFADSIDE